MYYCYKFEVNFTVFSLYFEHVCSASDTGISESLIPRDVGLYKHKLDKLLRNYKIHIFKFYKLFPLQM
jgi:hypothetical protein